MNKRRVDKVLMSMMNISERRSHGRMVDRYITDLMVRVFLGDKGLERFKQKVKEA